LVAAFCARLGVPLVSFGAPEIPQPTEAGARRHRYRSFEAYLSSHPGTTILTAHHADDQAETILMRVLQGRSWQGLAGIPGRRGPYWRPLLGLRASVLAEVARAQGLLWHEDSTNQDPRYRRNLLRRQVFPSLEAAFPRAVEALGDLGRVWAQVGPAGGPSPLWRWEEGGGRLEARVWLGWKPVEREAQLLAAAGRWAPGPRISRRFLEAAAARRRPGRVVSRAWEWRWDRGGIWWGPVVHRPLKEYFVEAGPGPGGELGIPGWSWSATARPGSLPLEGVDPGRPWIWRSATPGMVWASVDDPDWDRRVRRRRLGSLDPGRAALVLQDGLIRAVVDPTEGRVLWAESPPGKLHIPGIFVTLVRRSDYERR